MSSIYSHILEAVWPASPWSASQQVSKEVGML